MLLPFVEHLWSPSKFSLDLNASASLLTAGFFVGLHTQCLCQVSLVMWEKRKKGTMHCGSYLACQEPPYMLQSVASLSCMAGVGWLNCTMARRVVHRGIPSPNAQFMQAKGFRQLSLQQEAELKDRFGSTSTPPLSVHHLQFIINTLPVIKSTLSLYKLHSVKSTCIWACALMTPPPAPPVTMYN